MAKEQTDSKEQVVDIDSLRQDTHNFNRGTEEGQQLMERSFKELGAGRSILLDREGNIIAGIRAPFTQGGRLTQGLRHRCVIPFLLNTNDTN